MGSTNNRILGLKGGYTWAKKRIKRQPTAQREMRASRRARAAKKSKGAQKAVVVPRRNHHIVFKNSLTPHNGEFLIGA